MFAYILLLIFLSYIVYDFKKAAISILVLMPLLASFPINSVANVADILTIIILFYSLYKMYNKHILQFKEYPFWLFSILLLISYILTDTTSHSSHIPTIIIAFIRSFAIMYITMSIIKTDRKYINYFFKNIIYFALIIACYGTIESISKSNFFVDLMSKWDYYTYNYELQIRYGLKRCYSLFPMHITNGAVSLYLSFTIIYGLIHGLINKHKFIIFILILLAFNTFATGARSVILSFIVMLLSFINPKILKNKWTIMILLVLITTIYSFNDYFSSIYDSFRNTDAVAGSSTEMRDIQFDLTAYYLNKSFWFGNGIGYIGTALNESADLMGAESLWIPILIDRGVIGAIVYIILFIIAIFFCLKHKSYLSIFFVISILLLYTSTSVPSLDPTLPLFFMTICINSKKNYSTI